MEAVYPQALVALYLGGKARRNQFIFSLALAGSETLAGSSSKNAARAHRAAANHHPITNPENNPVNTQTGLVDS